MGGNRYGQGMRHLWSLLAGLVAAPLAWLLLSTGQYRSVTTVAGWDEAGRFDTADLIAPAAFLAGAGVLLGLLGTLRWSPAGPLVAGLLFIVPTVLMFINPFDTLERFLRPDDGAARRLLGQDLQPWLPVENGTLLVLGALLLVAVLSVQRWRRWPAAETPVQPATGTEAAASGTGVAATGTGVAATGTGAVAAEEATEPDTMTDDEILAAAAEYEQQERTEPTTEPERTVAEEDEKTTDRDR